MKKNNLCHQYIKNVKSLFPIIGKEEKKYIKQLSVEVEDCFANENFNNLDELNNKFGFPSDVVNNYFHLFDTNKLIKRIQISKWIKYTLVTLLIIALICSFIWGYTTYHDYKIFSEEQSFYEELNID